MHYYGRFGPFWTAHGLFGRHSVTNANPNNLDLKIVILSGGA